jgi:hypothetical protein
MIGYRIEKVEVCTRHPASISCPHDTQSCRMAKLQFLGRVLPDIKVTVPPQDVTWQEPEFGIDVVFKIRINQAFINIECDVENQSPDNVGLLYIRALDLARASVNMIAFAIGAGINVVLDICIKDDGVPFPVFPINEDLGRLCTALDVSSTGGTIDRHLYQMVIGEEPFYRALNDLVFAISMPHVSAQSCGRAMDGLKHLIASPGAKEPQAWQQMRDALRIDRKYLTYITDTSAGPRHARPGHIPGSITTEVVRRSWIIMNRYFEYRKRGGQPLLLSEFPLLIE